VVQPHLIARPKSDKLFFLPNLRDVMLLWNFAYVPQSYASFIGLTCFSVETGVLIYLALHLAAAL